MSISTPVVARDFREHSRAPAAKWESTALVEVRGHGLKTHATEDRRAFRLRRLRGFTLVEVLATLMLMAIVLPAVMKGIELSGAAATAARRRTEAAGLAEEKLSEIVSTAQWQGGNLSGDFSPNWPDYHWQAVVQSWAGDTTSANLQQIDLTVTWTARGHADSLTLSTIAYVRGQQ